MATLRQGNKTDRNNVNLLNTNMSLHEMFRLISDQMTFKDVLVLKHLYHKLLPKDIIKSVFDGYSFLLALERTGRIDEYNLKYLMELLRIITRHDLLHLVTLRKQNRVITDPISEYMDANGGRIVIHQQEIQNKSHTALSSLSNSDCTSVLCSENSINKDSKKDSAQEGCTISSQCKEQSGSRKRLQRSCETVINSSKKRQKHSDLTQTTSDDIDNHGIKKRISCGIRLRVRAEYSEHSSVLVGAVHSTKPEPIERAFDKFLQANAILKSRDLGSIVCDIRFSELTYLDAFWRDYISGSLLEALKGIFITESLRQAVGLEGVRLLVSVDEDDYHAGRLKLLQNLT